MSRVLWLAMALQFARGRLDAGLLAVLWLVRVATELLAASRATSKLAPWLDVLLLAGLAATASDSWPPAWRPG